MQEPKALLKFNDKITFIQQITDTYIKSGVKQVIVVVNTELPGLIANSGISLPEEVKLIVNEHPEYGRFYSLWTGIRNLLPGNTCFFQNIDNPFTTSELLQSLAVHIHTDDVVIPVFQNKAGHPVLFSPKVAKEILSINNHELRINDFLRQFQVKLVETSEAGITININSRQDYTEAGFRT